MSEPDWRSDVADVEVGGISLPEFVLEHAGHLADKPALVDAASARSISYARLRGAGAAGGGVGLPCQSSCWSTPAPWPTSRRWSTPRAAGASPMHGSPAGWS